MQTESIGIQLSCPSFPGTSECYLKINRNNEVTDYPLKDQENVFDLMEEVERDLKNNSSDATSHDQDIITYQSIFNQLKAIDSKYVYKLSKDYKSVIFSELPDHPGHHLELQYDEVRRGFQVQRHSLPSQCGKLLGRNISEFLQHFESELGILDEFYGNLSDIDELCFVIAPVPVTTKDAYRIFKFSESLIYSFLMQNKKFTWNFFLIFR